MTGRTAKRSTRKAAETADLSEIIPQCVVYVQALASYSAGYNVDASGDSQYAGRGNEEPNDIERAYIRFFADEVKRCLKANCGTVLI